MPSTKNPPGKLRIALTLLAIPVTITLTGFLLSSDTRLTAIPGTDMPHWVNYIFPVLGLTLIAVCAALLIRSKVRIARAFIITYLALAVANLIASVALLVMHLTSYHAGAGGTRLLADSALLWLTNIQIFSLIYWTLDAQLWTLTGQNVRRDFFFPQQMQDIAGYENWEPDLFAYIYLAFTTSTTYGPTDMPAVSAPAKLLIMTQAAIALSLFTLTIARAVNIMG